MKDIHLTASNDDQYFVFEDVLYQVLLSTIQITQLFTIKILGNALFF